VSNNSEPLDAPFDVAAWFAMLDAYFNDPFMPEGRSNRRCHRRSSCSNSRHDG
jgi:hypothetical protein